MIECTGIGMSGPQQGDLTVLPVTEAQRAPMVPGRSSREHAPSVRAIMKRTGCRRTDLPQRTSTKEHDRDHSPAGRTHHRVARVEPRHIARDGAGLHALWRPGIGMPLVFVPGVMTDAKGWRRVVASVEGPEPTLILNRRGRVPSGPLGNDYGIETEVLDLLAWLDWLDEPARLFGWSYGGLVAIETATRSAAVRHVIAYEPVLRPFGAAAVPALHAAVAVDDLDRAVEVVNLEVSKYSPEHVAALRASPAWESLRLWAAPVAQELAALNAFTPDTGRWAALEVPVDLVVGEHSRDADPYGTAFTAVERLLPGAAVHVLPGQGHLAHIDAPEVLGNLVSNIVAGRATALD
ncbi:pimeloyl-ACP methyl ester carboxylesterase [Actinoplanes octamycinicus]|uniref:Pimeloyl-ACP methyl ester carboxylesterase n=2 Tax=Actinoplanes octamycinicus TaxID=135948 RepID=A0A7W7H4U8_9ACTN|nr:alpha/beta hydrolase [Actinoplanes octamycinicus]MBB4744040.1 pimeloyl-ACP methyl ester carboxylesterase [Actinoplanes octamycinicus]